MILLVACASAPPPDARVVASAFHAVAADPHTWPDCLALASPSLRADCLTAAAEALAPGEIAVADAICDEIGAGPLGDECRFQVAEHGRDPGRCAGAGVWAPNCRAHLWGESIPNLFPVGMSVPDAAAKAELALPVYGFPVNDRAGWFEVFQHVLDTPGPLDRARCEPLTEPRRGICRETAVHLYRQRLDRAYAARGLPCPGQPVPPEIDPLGDPDLETAWRLRASTLRCP